MGGVAVRQICLPVPRLNALTLPWGRALATKTVPPDTSTPPTIIPGMRADHRTSPLVILTA